MHPSNDIRGMKGSELSGKKIVLCISGSVAAVKCPELARELMRHGADVRAVMTPRATQLITPQLMHWATGNEVVVELTGALEHVQLAEWADLILVAPATANTLSKIACAIDDTSVTSVVSVALGLNKPLAVVPAMHASMYEHKFLQENLTRLKNSGVNILEPLIEERRAKLPSVQDIVYFVIDILDPKDMIGMKVLVTAGPTIEPIDPIKFITNRSSGKMGIAIARVAVSRGAEATLVYGPGSETPPAGVKTIRVNTTEEMQKTVERELENKPDIIVFTAAAQDLVVERSFDKKLRHSESVDIKLVPAPRVSGKARELAPKAFIVGFKAEHGVSDEELHNIAKSKLESERFDMVVANDVSKPAAGFGTATNDVLIVTDYGVKAVKASKVEIARVILDEAIKKIRGRN